MMESMCYKIPFMEISLQQKFSNVSLEEFLYTHFTVSKTETFVDRVLTRRVFVFILFKIFTIVLLHKNNTTIKMV